MYRNPALHTLYSNVTFKVIKSEVLALASQLDIIDIHMDGIHYPNLLCILYIPKRFLTRAPLRINTSRVWVIFWTIVYAVLGLWDRCQSNGAGIARVALICRTVLFEEAEQPSEGG